MMVTHGWGGKFVVALFSPADHAHVPTVLAGYSRFVLPREYKGLYALLTAQTKRKPKLGGVVSPDDL